MQTNGDSSTTDQATGHGSVQRYSIPEAAKILSLTEEAVRQRVKRGTLDSIKVEGKLYVLLDVDTSNDTSRLVDTLEDEVAHLRRQLEQANERDRENRRIIAALTSRIPELPSGSPPEPRESPEAVIDGVGGNNNVPQNPQDPEKRRSFLYRFFFGP
jgi:hypothetical protein